MPVRETPLLDYIYQQQSLILLFPYHYYYVFSNRKLQQYNLRSIKPMFIYNMLTYYQTKTCICVLVSRRYCPLKTDRAI